MRPPSARFLVDRLLFFPRTSTQDTRGGPKPVDGTPGPEVLGMVQVGAMESAPAQAAMAGARRFGKIVGVIILTGPPPVAVATGWRIHHIGKTRRYQTPITFDPPVEYIATAAAIPPGSGRGRWTISIERDA